MPLLYDSPVSGNCFKVRLLLAHLGIAYERREVDVLHRGDRESVLGGLNPGLEVPTIVLDDGRPLGESNAILLFLAEGTDYLPEDRYERAQVHQWLFFEQSSHETTIASVRYWVSIAEERPPQARIAEVKEDGYAALDAMEGHLAGRAFLVAERFTVADIALYAYTHVAPEGGFDLGRYPAIRAWLDRVAAVPGHVTIDA